LDSFSDIQPAKIIQKVKIHLLPHLLQDIPRFGPAVRYSTETFECFNAIFRFCSIFSNHQAPSRDIAAQFASMDRLKHLLSGGYWQENGVWTQAGPAVLRVLQTDTTIQRHLGWAPHRRVQPGLVRMQSKKKPNSTLTWSNTQMSKAVSEEPLHTLSLSFQDRQVKLQVGLSVTVHSGDRCPLGSWVFARNTTNDACWGRICEILVPEGNQADQAFVTLEQFSLGQEQHPHFKMPVLSRVAERRYIVVESQVCGVHFFITTAIG
jgi:hypothetical protein